MLRPSILRPLRKLVRRNEFLRTRFRRAYRFLQYSLARALLAFRKDEVGLLYVDPKDITYTVSRYDNTWRGNDVWHFGTINGGDWDKEGYPIREYLKVYPILKKRIIDQLDLTQIPEFQEHLVEIENGGFVDGCLTKEEYFERWRRIEALCRKVKEQGYKTQVELGTDNALDEVRVQIGRKGELLLEEGRHRLAIAQILNLEKIPVIVTRRHQEWEALRQDIIKIVLQRGFVHQPFNHPDLDILPQIFGGELKERARYGNERWEYIVNSLPVRRGTVLDIGTYFGYFVYRFEELGFECYAVEPDPENLAVLKRYRQMQDKHFMVWECSLFDIERFDFDVVLALNIFHHLVKTKYDYERLVEFLNKLRCQALYFEPQQPPADAYRRFTDEEFVAFVLQHSVLNHSRLLGRAREGRNVYLLTV
ncbi:MAG: class I SAM-dependent methyltransferase [Chloroflexi bacterium]|nr:class I SAM-dependent methyltransferase [Chloroflexota bacterium]MCI0725287.1 class I SAM-dependent methyltransferase [Chloroflexota bacterium]